MGEKNIAKLVQIMRSGKDGQNEAGVMLAEITSVSPVAIRVSDVTVSSHIYVNAAYTFGESLNAIETAFKDPPEPAALFLFLKEFHKKYILKPGDTVIVFQSGICFYIAEKVG